MITAIVEPELHRGSPGLHQFVIRAQSWTIPTVRWSLLVNMSIKDEVQKLHATFSEFVTYVKQRDEFLFGPLTTTP